jgi:cytochrome c2
MARNVVSKQISHNGGTARVEQDGERLFVVCTGCGYSSGDKKAMAPALAGLVNHTEGRA